MARVKEHVEVRKVARSASRGDTRGGARRIAGIATLTAGAAILVALAVAALASAYLAQVATNVSPRPTGMATADANAVGAASAPEADAVDWAYWHSVNPDIVGWIQVPGTSIDLPVVQASPDDPQHYLSHDVYGNWNYHGCPYVDCNCKDGLDSPNVVIYGHNLIDRTMFTQLEGYHDQAFAEEHPTVVLHTPDGTHRLRVAGAETVIGSQAVKRTEFADTDDLRTYTRECLSRCIVRLPDVQPSTTLLTLCTCSYFQTPADERTLIYAVP